MAPSPLMGAGMFGGERDGHARAPDKRLTFRAGGTPPRLSVPRKCTNRQIPTWGDWV